MIERSGAEHRVVRGMEVFVGDQISTSTASSVQIRMMDGGLIALRPQTQVILDAFSFQNEESDTSITTLSQGGLRTVTGALGRQRPDNVTIQTPVATMGIRGTDMDSYYADQQAVLRVNTGQGKITSALGRLNVSPGQIARVRLGERPRFIAQLPAEFEALDEESTREEQEAGEATTTPSPTASASNDEEDADLERRSTTGLNTEQLDLQQERPRSTSEVIQQLPSKSTRITIQ
ncbi:FecR family protein [Marinospirillum sp.]|uniref:FecR family protein n=1 Tax=Marinospirillum sp. TaxID=2183934 RepID=UPI003A8848C2